MRFRSRLRIVRHRLAPALVAILCACSPGEQGTSPPAASARPSGSALAPWSRGDSASSERDASDASPPPATTVDTSALDELLAAAPKGAASATGEDGSSAIGTDTGVKPSDRDRADAPKEPASQPSAKAPPPGSVKVSFGALSIQNEMSSASIEREARAQLYWPLVQRCRNKDGSILPPDVVTILFRIDEDGYIIGSSINATPSKPTYEDAAHCMRRELSAATFRAPVGARGLMTIVTMTVPSVD